MTLGQETRLAYSTTLPSPHEARKEEGMRRQSGSTPVSLLPAAEAAAVAAD